MLLAALLIAACVGNVGAHPAARKVASCPEPERPLSDDFAPALRAFKADQANSAEDLSKDQLRLASRWAAGQTTLLRGTKMSLTVPEQGHFAAFSMLIDINSFTALVANHQLDIGISTFVRDVFAGAITAVERNNGAVIGINGDALFAVLLTHEDVFKSCVEIARDISEMANYLSGTEFEKSISSLPTMKIGIEHGWLDASSISTDAMGKIPFCIGPATNYASRILQPGHGNRCHVGPKAMAAGMAAYVDEDLENLTAGKPGEGLLSYWRLSMADVWVESPPDESAIH